MFLKLFKPQFIIFFIFAFIPLSGRAYEIEYYPDAVENRIVVSPTKLDLILQAGQEIEREVLVINRLGRREKFFIKTEGLINKEKLANLDQNYYPNSAVDWIEPEIDSVELSHGERIKLKIIIKTPKNLEASGYYATTVIGVKSEGESNAEINFVSQIGVPILISIPGEVKELGIIEDFFSSGFLWHKIPTAIDLSAKIEKKLYFVGPVKFFSSFKNLGNIHLMSKGEIAVYNFLGKKVAQIPLKETTVLPGDVQRWKASWNKNWLLGKYRAELSLFYKKNQTEPLKKEIVFYAFPVHLLILILAIIFLLHRIIKKIQNKYEIRRKDKKIKRNEEEIDKII